MKLNKIFYSLIAMLSLMVAACSSSDDYEWATATGNQVYFSNEMESTFEISATATSFNIPVKRVNADAAINVPITVSQESGSIFTVPSSVSFNAGEKEANITITYDPNNITYGNYEELTLTIGDETYTTEYGFSSVTFSAGATEWADISTNKSMGSYREDLMTTFYGVDNVVYDVKIQKSVIKEGMYRMVNPYGKAYEYNEEGDWDTSKDYYWVINATDPDYVYFEKFQSGMIWKYGEFSFSSLVAYYLEKGNTLEAIKSSHPEYFGTLKDGIFTMPASTMLISMANYNSGGWYQANNNGMLAVALPGYVIADYSIEASYTGRFTDLSDNDYAQFSLTFGSDVASVKYALVSSSEDVDAVANGIIDGSVEAAEATEAGSVQVAFEESGKYTLVMVVYNAKGEAVGTGTTEVKLKSSKDSTEVFTDIAAGNLTIGAKDQSGIFSSGPWGLCFKETITQEAVLSQSSTNPTKFRLTPYLKDENPLEFTVSEDGTIVVDGIETGITTDGGALIVTDLITLYGGSESSNGAYLLSKGYGSSYDKETSTYNFNIAYTCGGDWYGVQLDTFKVTASSAKAISRAINKARKSYSTGTATMKGQKHLVRSFVKDAKFFAK